jgi:hypothetical protein
VDENTLWIPISKVPENQRVGLRADMAARRVRYRYLDAAPFKTASDENQPAPPRKYVERDPGAAFWHCARINWTWSAAVAGSVVISGLEVRLDGASVVAVAAKKVPYAENQRWKELVRAEFKRRRASGIIAKDATLAGTARELVKWLKTKHDITKSWQAVQGSLPARSKWPIVSLKV